MQEAALTTLTYLLSYLLTYHDVVCAPVRDNDNLKSHTYVCITTYQPHTKSNPNHTPNTITKQHAIVNIQLYIVACPRPTYPDKFIRDMLLHRLHYFGL